jgi:saccharopine dehydrogenase-like NADP-dependent oxidoreductase
MILNSTPFSGQYDYKKDIWDNYIINLNNHFKIITTTKVDGVLCTYDYNLTIKDIASLSTKAKVVIAINSGVMPGLLNYYTLTTVKHFYIFDNRCYYSYPNFENKKYITDISIDELTKYIN